MSMSSLMIEMPDDLDSKLRIRAIECGFPTAEEYVRALIAADSDRSFEIPGPAHLTFNSKPELDRLLQEGIDSGDSGEITAAEWTEKRQRLIDRYSKSGAK
jgi:plasmid stability protein